MAWWMQWKPDAKIFFQRTFAQYFVSVCVHVCSVHLHLWLWASWIFLYWARLSVQRSSETLKYCLSLTSSVSHHVINRMRPIFGAGKLIPSPWPDKEVMQILLYFIGCFHSTIYTHHVCKHSGTHLIKREWKEEINGCSSDKLPVGSYSTSGSC